MIEALIITLREGLEAALVFGLILTYLRRIGKVELSKFIYAGLVLALAASAFGAYLFQTLNVQEEQADIIEAYMMLAGSFFVGTMIVWMFRASKNMRRQMEQRIDEIVERKTSLKGLSLLLLAFVTVFREGVEIILFLASLSLRIGSNSFLIFSGGALGILVAVVLGVLIVRGLVRINLRLFFAGTGIVLMALIVTLVANAIHNFAEFNVLSLTADQLSLIGLLIRDDTSIIILVSLIAVPTLLITLDSMAKPLSLRLIGDESPSKRRLRTAEVRRTRVLRMLMGAILTIVVISVGASWAILARGGYDPPVVPMAAQNGTVAIPLSDLVDGLMHKYSVEIQGVEVRFFAIQPSGEGVKVALDACYICPPAGYYLKEDSVVCKNCDAPINFDTIGLPGGCNPRVIGFRQDDASVIIKMTDLEASRKYFAEG